VSSPADAADCIVTNGAYIGEIIGLQLTGYLVGWYGNKVVMTAATALMIGFVSSCVLNQRRQLTTDLHLFLWRNLAPAASRSVHICPK
jgi:MFS family permease